jgi:hypothetical protein
MPPNLRDRLALVAAAADGYNPDPDPALWELDRAHYLAMVDAVLAELRRDFDRIEAVQAGGPMPGGKLVRYREVVELLEPVWLRGDQDAT